VVVLIDDLDRCEPQAAFRLLEGIKIYLTISNCVFVLGMDQRMIEDAVSEFVPGAGRNPALVRRRARDYLEKVFQEVYHLPIVQDVPSHLNAWLMDGGTGISHATRDKIKLLLTEYPGCIPANPRKIKAFATVLRRFLTESDKAKIANANFQPLAGYTEMAAKYPYESLALIMSSLYHFHPQIYRVLEAHPDEFYESLFKWCGRNAADDKEDHICMKGIDRAYRSVRPVGDPTANTLPEMHSLYVDYSRGDVLRVQKLILEARVFTKAQIVSLLLT
jgi:hypothetical protein